MNWISQHVAWLSEGVGGLVVVGIVGWFLKRLFDSKQESVKGEVAATSANENASISTSPVAKGSNITQTVNSRDAPKSPFPCTARRSLGVGSRCQGQCKSFHRSCRCGRSTPLPV